MSRGVVLWPDDATSASIGDLWSLLEANDVHTLQTETHQRHQPHCSLSVAESLDTNAALDAVGHVPTKPITLRVESVAVFPPNNALVLACVVNAALLAEQQRVHRVLHAIAHEPWPFFEADGWVPHITLCPRLSTEELARAIPLITKRLPIEGSFDRGGVEDGTSGENWPAPNGATR